ncbi:MAG: PDZ domain-containing protein [Deltaproteobacteria bacterium]|nr:PDZ domain-containing protein [Deltaproteobacteria bacterium]
MWGRRDSEEGCVAARRAGASGRTGRGRLRAALRVFPLAACLLFVPGATCEHGGDSWPGGIGAVLGHSSEEHRLVVREVPDDTPAAEAGLEPGDEILEIDGREVAALSVREVVAALRGEVGSRVRLRVRRGDDEREVEVPRAPYRD